jgi:hypothetical protein
MMYLSQIAEQNINKFFRIKDAPPTSTPFTTFNERICVIFCSLTLPPYNIFYIMFCPKS